MEEIGEKASAEISINIGEKTTRRRSSGRGSNHGSRQVHRRICRHPLIFSNALGVESVAEIGTKDFAEINVAMRDAE